MAAETAILYNGKRIIPAPQISFNRTHRRSADKSIIGTEHTVTLTGTLVGCKGWDFTSGSPEFYTGNDYPADDDNSVCNKFANLVEMQEQLRDLFEVDGDYAWLEIMGCDGLVRKWRARTTSLNFDTGNNYWTDTVPYTIVLELQTDTVDDQNLNIDNSESWEVSFDEENGGIYTLSHTLSCQSEEFASTVNDITPGWQVAKSWIDSRLAGADYTGSAPSTIKNDYIFNSTGFNLTNYTSYNYTVTRSLDEYSGTYSVTEEWTLAKDPVFRTWSLEFSDPRDDYTTVNINGTFSSFLNRTASTESTPGNPNAAIAAFNDWESASGPYTAANTFYNARGGCGTLGTCPVNKSVTITEQSRGDGSTAYGEDTRKVEFNYEFSDSDSDAEVSITRSLSDPKLDNCGITVTINGSIQGHTCSCDTTKLDNAQAAYAALTISDEADSVYSTYGGTGTLTLTSSSYTENEKDGTIEFTQEFSDKFEDGVLKEERITVSWACGDLKSDGTSKTIYTVDGTIKDVCGDSTPSAPDTSGYGAVFGDSVILRKKNVTTDSTNNVVNYNYEYDDDTDNGLVEITVDTVVGPEDCDNTQTTIELSVQGLGCNSADMVANAKAAINQITASDHAPAGSCKTSYRRNINKTRGTVRDTYTFTTECDATADVTITTSYDQNNCEDTSYSVEGEIKGRCFVGGGAMQAAEDLFAASYTSDAYSDYGCLASSKITRNEKTATIRFSYEFRDCEDGYEHEQTIAVSTNEQECCSEVTLSGTITPYCYPSTGESGMVTAGENAWTTIRATLSTTASSYCDYSNMTLRSTNISRNKKNGQIQYTYTYKCCNSYVDDALQESINITWEHPASVVAVVPILGRTCGPLIQDKGTKTVEKCSIAIDLTFAGKCSGLFSKPSGLETQIQGIISTVGCCSDAYNSYLERDTESWNPRTGRYTRNITYICECCD